MLITIFCQSIQTVLCLITVERKIEVEELVLNQTELTLGVGDTQTLTASLLPVEAWNEEQVIHFVSSNEEVITITPTEENGTSLQETDSTTTKKEITITYNMGFTTGVSLFSVADNSQINGSSVVLEIDKGNLQFPRTRRWLCSVPERRCKSLSYGNRWHNS